MPLKTLPYREVKRRLESAGFSIVSQKGSHVKFKLVTAFGERIAIVPKRKKGVLAGTIGGILKQTGISVEEWDEL